MEKHSSQEEGSTSSALQRDSEEYVCLQAKDVVGIVDIYGHCLVSEIIDGPSKVPFSIAYKIYSKIDELTGDFYVQRTYSDCLWLHGQLTLGFPDCKVPILPQPKLLTGLWHQLTRSHRNIDAKTTMAELNAFLRCLLADSELRHSAHLKLFLQSNLLDVKKACIPISVPTVKYRVSSIAGTSFDLSLPQNASIYAAKERLSESFGHPPQLISLFMTPNCDDGSTQDPNVNGDQTLRSLVGDDMNIYTVLNDSPPVWWDKVGRGISLSTPTCHDRHIIDKDASHTISKTEGAGNFCWTLATAGPRLAEKGQTKAYWEVELESDDDDDVIAIGGGHMAMMIGAVDARAVDHGSGHQTDLTRERGVHYLYAHDMSLYGKNAVANMDPPLELQGRLWRRRAPASLRVGDRLGVLVEVEVEAPRSHSCYSSNSNSNNINSNNNSNINSNSNSNSNSISNNNNSNINSGKRSCSVRFFINGDEQEFGFRGIEVGEGCAPPVLGVAMLHEGQSVRLIPNAVAPAVGAEPSLTKLRSVY
jgi:hypothetical protein